mgnify:CR=1 FL=1
MPSAMPLRQAQATAVIAGAPLLPELKFNLGDERHPLETLEGEDILFEGYRHMGKIEAVVAV